MSKAATAPTFRKAGVQATALQICAHQILGLTVLSSVCVTAGITTGILGLLNWRASQLTACRLASRLLQSRETIGRSPRHTGWRPARGTEITRATMASANEATWSQQDQKTQQG